MTLGIVFALPHVAGIVTDRKLTGVSKRDEDDPHETTKCGAVDFKDGRFCYSFTGVASAGKRLTAAWIARSLCESGSAKEGTSASSIQALETFRAKAGEYIKSLHISKADGRLTIAFAGFTWSAFTQILPRVILVTNFENLDGSFDEIASTDFRMLDFSEGPMVGLATTVGRQSFRPQDLSDMMTKIGEGRPASSIIEAGRQVIMNASKKDKYVGESINAVLIDNQPMSLGLAARYKAELPAKRIPAPSYVNARYGDFGAFYATNVWSAFETRDGEEIVAATPNVSRNRACSCGSGLKYKLCHGRKTAMQIASTTRIGLDLVCLAHPKQTVAIAGIDALNGVVLGKTELSSA